MDFLKIRGLFGLRLLDFNHFEHILKRRIIGEVIELPGSYYVIEAELEGLKVIVVT